MSNYSTWFVRDRLLHSNKGVLVYLNEDQQKKLNKKSVFIAARDDQYEFQFQKFRSVQIPMVRFHWYILKNCGYDLNDFLAISDYVDKKRAEIENKNAAVLKLSGQLSLEIETEKMFQIKNCSHKLYNLISAGDFETCYKCRMRRCINSKCETDLSFVKRLNDIVDHFGTSIQKVQHVISLSNMSDLKLYCVGPKNILKEGEFTSLKSVESLEDWIE